MKRALLCVAVASSACHGGGLSAEEALERRSACTFQRGAFVEDTLARGSKTGDQIPIDTFVILMFENRSFDHLLGEPNAIQGADVAPADASNLDTAGNSVVRFHQDAYCFSDTDHEWGTSYDELDAGKNDGFVRANAGAPDDAQGRRAMGFYSSADVPFIYALASSFAIGDRYFSSVLGPTDPNRAYLYAASSFGLFESGVIEDDETTILDAFDAHGISWAEYHESLPPSGLFTKSFIRHLDKGLYPPLTQFFDDAKNGKLPSVSFIDASQNGGAVRDDDHPPGDIQIGDGFLKGIFDAIAQSPQWGHAAIIVTFDECGGLYDHVPPPKACPPDDIAPKTATSRRFDRLGFRVPLVVASPYAKRRYVSHAVFDHTSILRLIEARFHIGALSRRDANADAMLDLFDFASPNPSVPELPSVSIDQDKLTDCMRRFPS